MTVKAFSVPASVSDLFTYVSSTFSQSSKPPMIGNSHTHTFICSIVLLVVLHDNVFLAHILSPLSTPNGLFPTENHFSVPAGCGHLLFKISFALSQLKLSYMQNGNYNIKLAEIYLELEIMHTEMFVEIYCIMKEWINTANLMYFILKHHTRIVSRAHNLTILLGNYV